MPGRRLIRRFPGIAAAVIVVADAGARVMQPRSTWVSANVAHRPWPKVGCGALRRGEGPSGLPVDRLSIDAVDVPDEAHLRQLVR